MNSLEERFDILEKKLKYDKSFDFAFSRSTEKRLKERRFSNTERDEEENFF